MRDAPTQAWTSRMRVLAALEGSDQPLASPIAPQSWTREGIAARVGLDPSVVSRHLSSLVEEGLLEYKLTRVEGLVRRRKVARMTQVGKDALFSARSRLLQEELVIEVDSGRLERRPLGSLTHLWPDLSITDSLALVQWLDDVVQPIPLEAGPTRPASSRVDDRVVHWAMASATDREQAIERAALLLARPLTVSSIVRWQLELLASEGSADGWRPQPLPGRWKSVSGFLLSGDWDDAPTGQSDLIDACAAVVAGEATSEQAALVEAAVTRGAPGEWLSRLLRVPRTDD